MLNRREPSSTMQAVCATRVDNNIADPIAQDILQHLPEARVFRDQLDHLSRGMFTRTILMRSAFFTKVLNDYDASSAQLIILCSGLDFRFLNHPSWQTKPTFLIDHPVSLDLTKKYTQAHKERLAHVKMISADLVCFSATSLKEQLELEGFDPALPTLFLWEGATYYFEPEVVDNILKIISSLCDKSTIAIDFANEGSFMHKQKQLSASSSETIDLEKTMSLLRKKQEPWFGFFSTRHIETHLNEIGYASVEIQWDADLEKDIFGDQQMVPESMFYVKAHK